MVDVAFLIVVSEVDDRHNAGIPEKWTFFEATLLFLIKTFFREINLLKLI